MKALLGLLTTIVMFLMVLETISSTEDIFNEEELQGIISDYIVEEEVQKAIAGNDRFLAKEIERINAIADNYKRNLKVFNEDVKTWLSNLKKHDREVSEYHDQRDKHNIRHRGMYYLPRGLADLEDFNAETERLDVLYNKLTANGDAINSQKIKLINREKELKKTYFLIRKEEGDFNKTAFAWELKKKNSDARIREFQERYSAWPRITKINAENCWMIRQPGRKP